MRGQRGSCRAPVPVPVLRQNQVAAPRQTKSTRGCWGLGRVCVGDVIQVDGSHTHTHPNAPTHPHAHTGNRILLQLGRGSLPRIDNPAIAKEVLRSIHPVLGLELGAPATHGLGIRRVRPKSAAELAGIKAGGHLQKANGWPVRDTAEFGRLLTQCVAGDTIELVIAYELPVVRAKAARPGTTQPAFASQHVRVELHGAEATIQAIRWLRLMATMPPAAVDKPASRLSPTDPLQRLSHMMAQLPEHVEALLQTLPVTQHSSLGAAWSAAAFRDALRNSALQLSESELELLMSDLVQGDTGFVSCSEFRLTMRCSAELNSASGHTAAHTGSPWPLALEPSDAAPSAAVERADRSWRSSMDSWKAMHRLAEAFSVPSQLDGLAALLAPFEAVSAHEVGQAVRSQCSSVDDADLNTLLTSLFHVEDAELRTQTGFFCRLRRHHDLLQTGWQLAHNSEFRNAMQELAECVAEQYSELCEELHSIDVAATGYVDVATLERSVFQCCGCTSTLVRMTAVLECIITFQQRMSNHQDVSSAAAHPAIDYRWLLYTIERTVVERTIHTKLERLGLLPAWVNAAQTLQPFREAIESIGQSTFGPLFVQVDTFKRSLRSLGVRMSASNLNGVVRAFDTEGSGLVDCRAWLAMSLRACGNEKV
jgi:hypothetical protein